MPSKLPLHAALIASTVIAAGMASAQSFREPRFTLDGGGTRVIAVSNLPEAEGCYPGTIVGRVVARRLDKGRLEGVTIKDARYETYINMPDAYEFRNRATYERVRDALDKLLVPGVDLQVKSAACGAAGRIVQLQSVALRNPGAASAPQTAAAATGSRPEASAVRDDAERVLLQAPGAVGQQAGGIQAERSDTGAQVASAPPSLPTRTAWRASAPTKVQFDLAISTIDRIAHWSLTCTRDVNGQIRFGNWLVGSRGWYADSQKPRISIDDVKMNWEIDGADEGVVLSNSMQGNTVTLSQDARAKLARGERFVIGGLVGRNKPRDAVFDISGGEAAFASFEARCQTLPRS